MIPTRMSNRANIDHDLTTGSERQLASSEADLYTILDAGLAVWRYRIMVTGVFFGTLAIVVLVTLLMKKSYLSESHVLARLGRENSMLDVAAGLGERSVYVPPVNRDAEINSLALMMTSKDLFANVVDQVGADRILDKVPPYQSSVADGTPKQESDGGFSIVDSLMGFLVKIGAINGLELREKAIIHLQKRMEATVNKQSHLVTIRYESHDPRLAQEVVSALVSEYAKHHARLHRSGNGSDFLGEQLESASQLLETSEMAFELFKTESGLVSLDDQRRVLVDRIAILENAKLQVDAELKSAEAEVSQLRLMLAGIPSSEPLTKTAGAGNAGVDGMRQELFRLQLRRDELLAKYSAKHPLAQQIEEQLDRAKTEFDSVESQLVESVEGRSQVYDGALLQLIAKVPQLDALRSKKTKLESQLAEVLENLAEFNVQETQFIRLQRRVQLCDEEYSRLERSWRQAVLDQELQDENLSNLSIVQPASYNPKPYRPNKLLNLIGGILVGGFLGCSLATLRDISSRSKKKLTRTEHDPEEAPVEHDVVPVLPEPIRVRLSRLPTAR